MYWANFLHIYQPPSQKKYWVQKIAEESYRKLTRGLKEHPQTKLTLNVNAVLLELFERYDCSDVITDLRELGEAGQIEFTGSAKYHPFLPLIPEREVVRQIELNTKTCRTYLGDAYAPKGFFPPEMAYARRIADIAHRMGFEWIILDELAHSAEIGQFSAETIYEIEGLDHFAVFFRDRATSFRILSADINMSVFSAKMLQDLLGDRLQTESYLVTAMDGETFGHHRPGLEDLLFDFYTADGINAVHVSELLTLFPQRKAIEPRESTWALMKRDIERNTPYSRWSNPDNEIHLWQWELANLAISEVEKLEDVGEITEAQRLMLDRAIHSDQFWWASAEPWWSIEMIESGARDLQDVILNLPIDESKKERARTLYQKIIYTAFDWQRSGKVDALARSADEDVTQRITTEVPYIPEEEFNRIVDNLTHQMETAAQSHEFERAAQIRDRVKELNEKKEEITKPR